MVKFSASNSAKAGWSPVAPPVVLSLPLLEEVPPPLDELEPGSAVVEPVPEDAAAVVPDVEGSTLPVLATPVEASAAAALSSSPQASTRKQVLRRRVRPVGSRSRSLTPEG